MQDRFALLAAVLSTSGQYWRRPDAIWVEVVILQCDQDVTGKNTPVLERLWTYRACCSLPALPSRSTSHRAGTRIDEAGARLLRRNCKQVRAEASSLTHGKANAV